MELLKQKILSDGSVIDGRILKVDSFINHQLDIELFNEIGREFKIRFAGKKVTKILTIESSGIAIASIAAQHFRVPVVFAKKHEALNIDPDTYHSKVYSFTKDKQYDVRVSKKYLGSNESILIIDDFLANGQAAAGLVDIVKQSRAELVGVGIVIEKGFQPGRAVLEKLGVRVESLVIVESMAEGKVIFK